MFPFNNNVAAVEFALVATCVPSLACAFPAAAIRTSWPCRRTAPPLRAPLTSRWTRTTAARSLDQEADDERKGGGGGGGGDDDGGDGPVWSGGTYSWKPSEERRKRRRRDDPLQIFDFAHCGTVRVRQRPDRLDLENGARRTGVTLWSAALAMAEYVDDRCGTGAWRGDVAGAGEGLTCLELGAGLGLPSAVAARHGLRVVATDGDQEVLPLLRENLASNLPGGTTVDADAAGAGAGADAPADGSVDGAGRVWAYELDWNEVASDPGGERHHPAFAALERCGRGADIILLSDLIYGATRPAWGALLSLLDRIREQRRRLLVGDDGGQADSSGGIAAVVRTDGTRTPGGIDPLVLLGYTQRRRDMTAKEEGKFFALVRRRA